MRARILKTTVKTFQPAEREYLVFDTDLAGFCLKVMPSGTKTYIVRYRMSGGRAENWKKVTIGKEGSPWTAPMARAEAERLLMLVRQGIDPAQQRKAEAKARFTISDLADRYLKEHVATRNKPSTAYEVARMVDRLIKPRLGAVAVSVLTRAEVSAWHTSLSTTPRQANHSLAVLSKMLSLAETWGYRADGSNPCGKIHRFHEKARERFLSDDELQRLGAVLAALAAERSESESALAGIRLLLLTGCRLGEVLAMRWEDIDTEAGTIRIRDAKAGARTHQVGAIAAAELAKMPRRGPWVLPGRDERRSLSSSAIHDAWWRIREKAGLGDVRLHDLRHTVGTYAGQTGANAFLVRDALGHRTLAMTGRYVNRDADPLRALSDAVATRITAALDGGKTDKPGK